MPLATTAALAETAEPETTSANQILIPTDELSKIVRAMQEGHLCCDEYGELLTECETVCDSKNKTIKVSEDALKACEDDTAVLQRQWETCSIRVGDVEETSWFHTAWDWFWPVAAVVLGGYVAGEQMAKR